MTTFYIRKDGKYKAVSESEYWSEDTIPLGFHLVEVKPGSTSWKFRINPDLVEFTAAMSIARDAMLSKMNEVNQLKVAEKTYPLHLRQKATKAWNAWKEIMGEDIPIQFEGVSMSDIIEAGLKAIQETKTK